MDGIIVMWAGAIVDIPSGWHLCDGTEGTPDLRNRFVFGALNQGEMNLSKGRVEHTHGFTGDGHVHSFFPGMGFAAGDDWESETAEAAADGTTDSASSMPPYYALAFIMFVGLPK